MHFPKGKKTQHKAVLSQSEYINGLNVNRNYCFDKNTTSCVFPTVLGNFLQCLWISSHYYKPHGVDFKGHETIQTPFPPVIGFPSNIEPYMTHLSLKGNIFDVFHFHQFFMNFKKTLSKQPPKHEL